MLAARTKLNLPPTKCRASMKLYEHELKIEICGRTSTPHLSLSQIPSENLEYHQQPMALPRRHLLEPMFHMRQADHDYFLEEQWPPHEDPLWLRNCGRHSSRFLPHHKWEQLGLRDPFNPPIHVGQLQPAGKPTLQHNTSHVLCNYLSNMQNQSMPTSCKAWLGSRA